MKYDRVYPVACPEPDCDADVGDPCNSHTGLMHLSRFRDILLNLNLKAAAARRDQPPLFPGQLPRESGPCRCAERRKES